jgi:hypothetical protein
MPKLVLLIHEDIHSQGYSISLIPTEEKKRFSFGNHPYNYLRIEGLLDFHGSFSYSFSDYRWLLFETFFDNSLLINGLKIKTKTHTLHQNDVISYNNISITIGFLETLI